MSRRLKVAPTVFQLVVAGEDGADAELFAVAIGGVGDDISEGQGIGGLVGAHDIGEGQDAGGGIDMRCVDFFELLEVGEDLGDLALIEGDIGIAQFEAGEIGDGADVFGGEGGFWHDDLPALL